VELLREGCLPKESIQFAITTGNMKEFELKLKNYDFLMKSLFLLILLTVSTFIYSQEKFEKYTINFELTHPVINSGTYDEYYFLNPGFEVLTNFRIIDSTKISTGIGFQFGQQHRKQEVNKIVTVDGRSIPWNYTYHWMLNLFSIKLPFYINIPLRNSFLDFFVGGVSFGWFWKYNLTGDSVNSSSEIKIDRPNLNISLGTGKELMHSDNMSIAFSPIVGYQKRLTHHNDWQKNYFFYKLKLSINLKN
jgi:hypothetical protein